MTAPAEDPPADLLKMSELVEASGVSPATVKHYLQQGLLPEPVRTSRNMAYYPRSFVERIRIVKRLQEERFMPLRAIREVLDAAGEDPDALATLLEHDRRIVGGALSRPMPVRVPRAEAAEQSGLPTELVDKLAELGIVEDRADGLAPDELRILEAVARLRATGFGEHLGFTAHDSSRYVAALEPLVRDEIATFLRRMRERRVDPDRAVDLAVGAIGPLRDIVGALHGALLRRELERRRGSRRGGGDQGPPTPRTPGGADGAGEAPVEAEPEGYAPGD